MNDDLSASAQKVQETLAGFGHEFNVVELPDSTRTAKDAANAIGCEVAHIAKSLIFRGEESGRPVLVIASGVNRVDEEKVAQIIGEPIGKANAAFVREQTGFAIGGVPPVGHQTQPITLIDADLLQYEQIWAAAGTPHAVFSLKPEHLTEMTGGRVTAVS
jgi:prolyl-tRNA editing enzyme YbaK/EbsC (Cys-tRNA(Pro) deacylase)